MGLSIRPVANKLHTREGREQYGHVICMECGLPMWRGPGTCRCTIATNRGEGIGRPKKARNGPPGA